MLKQIMTNQPNAGSDTKIIYIYKLTLTILVKGYILLFDISKNQPLSDCFSDLL
jgi:hypothetical protein